MYTTGPPTAAGTARLHVRAAARRRFDPPPAIADRPGHAEHLHRYLSDLVAPYRLDLRADLATDRTGHSYGEMADALVAELVPEQRPIDLLVLAFTTPDVRPGRSTATYLSERCPGKPLAFAICDQGSAAAFTGLRLIDQYARTAGCHRSLLLVVEQATVPYDAGIPVDLPVAHTAVGLRCELAGSAPVAAIRQHPSVSEDQLGRLLAAELAALAPDGTTPYVIADRYLADRLAATVPADRLCIVPPGQPHTGTWWELAGQLAPVWSGPAQRQGPRRVVLAAYERQLGYLCLSAVDIEPAH